MIKSITQFVHGTTDYRYTEVVFDVAPNWERFTHCLQEVGLDDWWWGGDKQRTAIIWEQRLLTEEEAALVRRADELASNP